MTDDGGLNFRAQVVDSRHALVIVHAATRVPADAHALSRLEPLGIWPRGRDPADDLVPENHRVPQNTPVIVQDGNVRVAQTAIFHRDFNVLGAQRSGVYRFEHHRLFGRFRDPRFVILIDTHI